MSQASSQEFEEDLIQRQIAYYRARAHEYDHNYAERIGISRLCGTLDALPISGHLLELACGTGQWTRLIKDRAQSLTVLDAAPEMLAVARQRLLGMPTTFVEADVFRWQPTRRYDTVFFAFWLTHVPPGHFSWFWLLLRSMVSPGGRVVFIDDRAVKAEIEERVGTVDHPLVRRRLADGSEHLAVKVFHDIEELASQLGSLGWDAEIKKTDPYHFAGIATLGIS